MSDNSYQVKADKFIFNVKKGLLYAENDVWTELKDGGARIGVTDYLQRTGGDVVFIDLPKEGTIFKRLDEVASYETIKSIISVASPLSGRVLEINARLNDSPELVNEDPYGEGWLVEISATHADEEKKHLITAEEYLELMKSKINERLREDRK